MRGAVGLVLLGCYRCLYLCDGKRVIDGELLCIDGLLDTHFQKGVSFGIHDNECKDLILACSRVC